MKYKLINLKTKEEYLCEKIILKGFDYYIINERPKMLEWFFDKSDLVSDIPIYQRNNKQKSYEDCYKIIATNNPNINLPQIVDEFLQKGLKYIKEKSKEQSSSISLLCYKGEGFIEGYKQSQETHHFSEEDVIEFLDWIRNNCVFDAAPKPYYIKTQQRYSQKELLEIWKQQKLKTFYYE